MFNIVFRFDYLFLFVICEIGDGSWFYTMRLGTTLRLHAATIICNLSFLSSSFTLILLKTSDVQKGKLIEEVSYYKNPLNFT